MITAPCFGIGAIHLPAQRSCAAIDDRSKVLANRRTSSSLVPAVSCGLQNLLQQIAVLHSACPPALKTLNCVFGEICDTSRCIDLRDKDCIQHSEAIGD